MALNIGDSINNTAFISFEKDGQTFSTLSSNTTEHLLRTRPTTAIIEFFSGDNSLTTGTCPSNNVSVASQPNETNAYHIGDNIFVQVTDPDQNTDNTTKQTITITVDSTDVSGIVIDSEELIAMETDVDSGIFIALVPSTPSDTSDNDCVLSLALNSQVAGNYSDQRNADNNTNNIVRTSNALVDPFGTVFDSTTGVPINNAIVSIYNANPDGSKGSLATVFADAAGTISWPNMITTGVPFTDGNGTSFDLPAGNYWFPFIAPGDYIIEAITGADYIAGPSTQTIAALSANPSTSTYTVVTGSFEDVFSIPINATPVRIDIPKDPVVVVNNNFIITKEASVQAAGIGEFVEYTLNLSNEGNAANLGVFLVDTLPRGLAFVPNSARSAEINNFAQPTISANNRQLTFNVGTLTPSSTITIKYLLKVTIDSLPGIAVNTVFAQDNLGNTSNQAQATIQIQDDFFQNSNQIIGQININTCTKSDVHSVKITPTSITKEVISYNVDLRNINYLVNTSELSLALDPSLELIAGSVFIGRENLKPTEINNQLHIRLPVSKSRQSNVTFKAKIISQTKNRTKAKASVRFTQLNKRSPLKDLSKENLLSLELTTDSNEKKFLSFLTQDIMPSQNLPKEKPSIDLSGIRIMMEDGRYAITDKNGRFHLDDVSKGTHIVQLDTYSLPDNLEISHCVKNTRFAGNPSSRFVDLQGGTLWRTDFYVHQKADNTEKETHRSKLPITENTLEDDENENTTRTIEYSKSWLNKQPETLAIHEPSLTYANLGFINISIQHPLNSTLSVLINGKPINNANFGKLIKGSKNFLKVWSGVHLRDGKNIITAISSDKNNIEIERVEKTISFSSRIAHAELIVDESNLIADGRTPPIIAVKFTTSGGNPIHKDLTGNFEVNQPYSAFSVNQELLKSNIIIDRTFIPKFTIGNDGIAHIKLTPTTQSGKVSLTFTFNGQEQTIDAWLKPKLRDWILVGLAEGSIIDSKIKAHMEDLSEEELKEGYQKDGRVAFFAKGKIKSKWLLTLAYDTSKESKQRIERENIDPDLFFTLYGDQSSQYQDALSSKKLYLKIENQHMYALFGDFSTNLNKTELSSYSRSFTGIKSEGSIKNVNYTVFAAKENSTFQKEELKSNGTSGPYSLSQQDILIGSEKIVIETRDRTNQSLVLETKTLNRFIDYTIDYFTGRILFKNIVPNTDINFNPIYIVVDYESNVFTDGDTSLGGRIAYESSDKKLEIGTTYVDQQAINAKGTIAGIDVTIKPTTKHEIKLETAKTTNQTQNTNSSSSAYLAKYKYSSENLTLESRISRNQAGFGLGQQLSNTNDILQYNVRTQKKINNALSLEAELDRQERISLNDTINNAGLSLNYKYNKGSLRLGYKRTEQNISDVTTHYDILSAGIQQRFKRLNTFARIESSLNDDISGNKPQRLTVGADYALSNNFSIFEKTEINKIDDSTVKLHQAGLKARPWSGGEFTTGINRQLEDGIAQDYANYSFTQRYALSKKSSTDLSYEEGRDISSDNSPFNGLSQSSSNSSENFKSSSLGFNTHQDSWSLQHRVEFRESDTEKRYGFLNRWYRAEKDGVAFGLRTQAFSINSELDNSLSNSIETELSSVYRPYTSKWSVMDRLILSFTNQKASGEQTKTRKIVNHLRTNYLHDDENQISFAYGIKHILQDFQALSDDNTLHFASSEYRHDLTPHIDMGLRTSMLFDEQGKDYKYAAGMSLGASFVKNTWFSIGYNFTGFNEEDFNYLDNSNKGWRIDFRIKFDQDSLKLNKK